MATKVYDSPTLNIFALLADENAGQSQPKKTNNKAAGPTGPQQESTPKERAEARAVQDAARKQQREAEKAKKELEAARKKALELIDDTGFSQQRHQRIKDARQQALVEPVSPKSHKARSKDGWDDTDAKGKGKPWTKPDGEGKGKAPAGNKTDLAGSPKTDVKAFNKPKGDGKASNFTKGDGKTFKDNKGDKTFNKGEGKGNFKGEGKVPFKNEGSVAKGAKSYDKHSQGVTSRQFQPKKQGHGKANWDENVPAGLSSAPVKDALASEALAAPASGEVDGWGESPATGAETGATDATSAPTDGKDKDARDTKTEEDEDAAKKTLEDYFLEQAEKKKALEAVVKALTPQTTVTEEEKKALSSKFTFFENPQAAKPETPKPAVAAPKAPAAAPKAPAVATPPTIATGFRVAGSRAAGRPGRFEGQQRDNARPGGQRKGGRGPQKILKGKNEFPALSSTTK